MTASFLAVTITSVYFPSTSPFKHFVSKPRDVEQWFVTLLAEFNFLVGEIQPLRENCSAFVLNNDSCDLLSILVLCIIVTNRRHNIRQLYHVVICFQFQFFVLLLPTLLLMPCIYILLWFAFNFSSLYYCYQPESLL